MGDTPKASLVPHYQRFIVLGVISSAHGIRGEVKIKSFTSTPATLTSYGTLHDKQGHGYALSLRSHHKDALICGIEGVSTRTDAEKLRGVELGLPRHQLPATQKGEYYFEDIKGLSLTLADGSLYGQVIAMHDFGAGAIAEIQLQDGNTEMLPFQKAIFQHIELESGKAVIELPEVLQDKR